MDSRKYRKISYLGSVFIHIIVFLIIAFTGILSSTHAKEDIVEIAFVGGGGGSGDSAATAEIAAEQQDAAEDIQPLENDAIVENMQEKPKPQVKKAAFSQSSTKSSNNTGEGSGSGSGTGSGGGHGSGVGTGSGSGIGPGNGATSNPAVPPRIIKSSQPVYPSAERNAKIEGTAILRLLITTDGTVENVTVVSSSGNSNLDAAAVKACYKWRFISAKNSVGTKIPCYANIPITFKIRT